MAGNAESRQSRHSGEKLTRLDIDEEVRKQILPYCRLKAGEIWSDSIRGHRVGVLDAAQHDHIMSLFGKEKTSLVVNDPPYNVKVGKRNTSALFKKDIRQYLEFSRNWILNALQMTEEDAHFLLWIGADYRDNFQPLPELMLLMRQFKELSPKNFITLRNQRGYGTQGNWMWIRQELLHYVKGNPDFTVVYTDIPKVLKGYYKAVGGRRMENMERSKSSNIRPGNVWIDIQQVFYRMKENVPGCYAQKPLKALERILRACSGEGDLVADFFSHSGTTLIAGEKLRRKVYTMDCDPVYAEITIRRLEHFRRTGEAGFQWRHPFPEIEEKNGIE